MLLVSLSPCLVSPTSVSCLLSRASACYGRSGAGRTNFGERGEQDTLGQPLQPDQANHRVGGHEQHLGDHIRQVEADLPDARQHEVDVQ